MASSSVASASHNFPAAINVDAYYRTALLVASEMSSRHSQFERNQLRRLVNRSMCYKFKGFVVTAQGRTIIALSIIELSQIHFSGDHTTCIVEISETGLCELLKVIRLFKTTK